MAVPGLTGAMHGRLPAVLSASATTTSLHTALGSPSGPVKYMAFLKSGTLGSTSVSTPALDATTGMDEASEGIWIITNAVGCGGDGSDGAGAFGGGGGGAGSAPGTGGSVNGDATPGSDGGTFPTTTGGAAGANGSTGSGAGAPAEDGGDAVWLNHTVTIYLSGTIGGGGGGGASGGNDLDPPFGVEAPTAGGDLGQPGGATLSDLYGPGVAGYAIRYSGSGAATVIGGTVLGTVG